MSLAGAISSLGHAATYTVTRRAPRTYTGPRLNPASVLSTFDVVGQMTPASGRDLLRLPEGLRSREARRFITGTELKAAAEGAGGDVVAADGFSWEVSNVKSWGGEFFDVVLTRAG